MKRSIVGAVGVVLVMNLVTKILGFARESFIAWGFGSDFHTDAYFIAYTLPYFLQAILGFALVTAVVPVLTRYLVDENYDEAWHVASTILNLTLVVLTLVTLLGIMGATVLVKITAPGFNPVSARLAVTLTQIMFPSVVFMGVGMVITGILNASYKFAVAAFAPGFSNLIIIFSVIFFSAHYGITGLAVGTLLSFLGFLLLQVPFLKSVKFKYSFVFDIKHPAVRQLMVTIGPIILGVAVNQINLALNRVFASWLAEGSISALNYAMKLMNLPQGVFVAAVASAIYPTLAAQAIKGDKKSLSDTMLRGLSMVSLITIPAAVGLMVLRVPIVQLLFEQGAFDHKDTIATASGLLYYALGLFPGAAYMVITRAYYAVGDVRTPVVAGIVSVGVNVILSVALMGRMSHSGLALAYSLATAAGTWFLFIRLKQHLPSLKGRELFVSFGKICLASGMMAIVAWLAADFFSARFDMGAKHNLALAVMTAISAGGLSYFIFVVLLKVEDVRLIWQTITGKLKKNRV
ncbi:murein biosynthesis integral membrane protein MurJ [Candidatus Formimonas warabiya]|uniref:Probable lipid II flippase MurJ n=1 Tax=Formimonas warabiya TaxID=1761012 RepID=A0A3G1KU11_FORW1|nr:murein biosynthesis integral membrane protein MurJ [Candidatus Formimonas warabiya]ATW25942.1 murein biosynthesis integral membrane protein MurJ [Candidatus Formimonas warabiya]